MEYRRREEDSTVRRLEHRIADLEQYSRRSERVHEVMAERLQDLEAELQAERGKVKDLAEILVEALARHDDAIANSAQPPPPPPRGTPSLNTRNTHTHNDQPHDQFPQDPSPTGIPKFCYGCGAHRVHASRFCQMCGITFPSSPQRELGGLGGGGLAGLGGVEGGGGGPGAAALDALLHNPVSTSRRGVKRLFT